MRLNNVRNLYHRRWIGVRVPLWPRFELTDSSIMENPIGNHFLVN